MCSSSLAALQVTNRKHLCLSSAGFVWGMRGTRFSPTCRPHVGCPNSNIFGLLKLVGFRRKNTNTVIVMLSAFIYPNPILLLIVKYLHKKPQCFKTWVMIVCNSRAMDHFPLTLFRKLPNLICFTFIQTQHCWLMWISVHWPTEMQTWFQACCYSKYCKRYIIMYIWSPFYFKVWWAYHKTDMEYFRVLWRFLIFTRWCINMLQCRLLAFKITFWCLTFLHDVIIEYYIRKCNIQHD